MDVTPVSRESEAESNPERDEQATFDQLVDQLKTIEGLGEETATFLVRHWQKILGVAVVVIFGIWLIDEVRKGKSLHIGEASEKYSVVQEEFEKVLQDPSNETANKIVTENSRLLSASYDDTTYKNLAQLYDVALLLKSGKAEEALTLVTEITKNREMKTLSAPAQAVFASKENFVRELGALLKVRATLGTKVATVDGVNEQLKNIAYGGAFMAVEAVLLSYQTADSDEARKSAISLANELRKARPELQATIDSAFEALGVSLLSEPVK